mmetsp:Transcript_33958/g.39560  ORF Transcript_33958/g.39560 Transcript_33958/m.39560 type:complete len:248 (+) Transcript_33958:373-1116(+)
MCRIVRPSRPQLPALPQAGHGSTRSCAKPPRDPMTPVRACARRVCARRPLPHGRKTGASTPRISLRRAHEFLRRNVSASASAGRLKKVTSSCSLSRQLGASGGAVSADAAPARSSTASCGRHATWAYTKCRDTVVRDASATSCRRTCISGDVCCVPRSASSDDLESVRIRTWAGSTTRFSAWPKASDSAWSSAVVDTGDGTAAATGNRSQHAPSRHTSTALTERESTTEPSQMYTRGLVCSCATFTL